MLCRLCIKYRNTLNVELQFELVNFCISSFVFYHQIIILNILFRWSFDDRTIITPDVAYGCENWPSRLTEEQRLKEFENEVIREIFWSNTEEVTGRWKNVLNNDLVRAIFQARTATHTKPLLDTPTPSWGRSPHHHRPADWRGLGHSMLSTGPSLDARLTHQPNSQ
jgi:hypothetical protein